LIPLWYSFASSFASRMGVERPTLYWTPADARWT
jgi:hypothetical protein